MRRLLTIIFMLLVLSACGPGGDGCYCTGSQPGAPRTACGPVMGPDGRIVIGCP